MPLRSSARRTRLPALCTAIAAALVLLAGGSPARARTSGINGYSGMDGGLYCSNAGLGCHEAASTTQKPMVRFEGPLQVEPGAAAEYRFVVVSRNPSEQVQAGLDIAVSAGELRVIEGEGTKLLGREPELTHTGPKDNDGAGEAAWRFIWVAPTTPGQYVLFGAGNSVNGDFTVDGDEADLTTLLVSVGDVVPTPTVTPAPTCAGDCNGDGIVAVNELVTGVNIALGTGAMNSCRSLDTNGDGMVSVNELIAAVARALNGC